MSTLTNSTPVKPSTSPFPLEWTAADLLEYLGGVPAHRVLLRPAPGTATEADVLRYESAPRKRLCELIDGVLVEKAMGYAESRIASILGMFIETFLTTHDLGVTAGEQGMMRLSSRRIRMPDLSFVSWEQFPDRVVPDDPIPNIHPNLAVEVLSVSNTPGEMRMKREDYFQAGTQLVWEIDPRAETVRVFTGVDDVGSTLLQSSDTLTGEPVLLGFRLPVRELFDRARRGSQG